MHDVQRGQKKTSDPPELELQVVVRHHVVNRNRTQVLYRKAVSVLTTEPSLQTYIGCF